MLDEVEVKKLFVWRRAFRAPTRSVVRAELIEAFGISNTAASVLLNSVVNAADGLLQREGNKVIAVASAKSPYWADETDLMASLDQGRTSFAQTGLRFSELPFSFSSWSNNLPSVPGAMTIIIEAFVRKHSTLILYVGLKVGDTARLRRIFPVALERMGDQWRLVAHDLELKDFPVRVFILARITGATADLGKLPRGFIAANPVDVKQAVAVSWNQGLNEDQKQALRSELSIDSKGVAHINSRDVHEFLIRFGARTVSDDIAWPPFQKAKKSMKEKI